MKLAAIIMRLCVDKTNYLPTWVKPGDKVLVNYNGILSGKIQGQIFKAEKITNSSITLSNGMLFFIPKIIKADN